MSKKVLRITNATCIDCQRIKSRMARVGAFVMCIACATTIFGETYDHKSEEYRSRLKKYMEDTE